MHALRRIAAITLLAVIGPAGPATAAEGDEAEQRRATALASFALDDLRVPRDEILAGGPARDAIRSVDAPVLAAVEDASWVRGNTPVIGLVIGEDARAYPVHVMEWHQVVNDRFGKTPVVIAYDPITDIATAWRAPEKDPPGPFGVSGLIHRAGFLLFDRQTLGLWSPATGEALSGARAGQRLVRLPVRVETMGAWLERQPRTRVLALPERRKIDYRRSPYSAYWISEKVPFPVRARDDRFHAKEVVLGVEHEGRARAYIGSILTRAGGRIVDDFASRRVRVSYDGGSGTFSYSAPDDVTVTSAYWFAWKNLHPQTEIWREDLAGEVPAEGSPPPPSR